MKNLKKVVFGLVATVILVGCKISDRTELPPIIGDPSGIDSFEYSHGGWFPGPSAPNFELLVSAKMASGGLKVTATTPECKATSIIDIGRLYDLADLAFSADEYTSDLSGVDMGDEQLSFGGTDGDSFFLRQGDQTHNRDVIVEADAKKIRAMVHAIADEVFARSNCSLDTGDQLKSIRIRQNLPDNKDPIPAGDKANMLPREVTDIKVSVEADQVVLNGYYKTTSGNGGCTTTFKKKVIKSMAWVKAANDVSIVHAIVICAKMAVLDGGYAPRYYTLTYGGDAVETGGVGCEFADRVQNQDALEKLLKAEIQKTDSVCNYVID